VRGAPGGDEMIHALAPAKVNLGLEVLGRRPDDFHEVCTTLLTLDLYDEIEVGFGAGRGGIELMVGGEQRAGVPADEGNLVWRAAEMVRGLAREAGKERAGDRLVLGLHKRIPAGAGLGGGSSDAAATLLAVAEAFELEIEPERARQLLATLGSDCPFFHTARSRGLARCTGRGDRVEVREGVEIPWWFLLVTPEISCATGAVYAALEPAVRDDARSSFDLDRVLRNLSTARAALVNELEAAALRSHPALASWKELLSDSEAGHFLLSGSGSSFFGLFDRRDRAEEVAEKIAVAAKARDLGLRGSWILRAAGEGVVLAPSK
jgi:4-diphosphocytidyl-2-C-methyl-D-erythritol kinase